MNDFESELKLISKKLDQIEAEIFMNQEAIESIEVNLRLLKVELDFESDKMV